MPLAAQEWIFDATDGSARLLKSRSGHAKAPTMIRYYVRTFGCGPSAPSA